MGIAVLPPDVNFSYHEFSVADSDNTSADIRFGMDAVKNVGKGAVEEIIHAREDGPFVSLNDFISRISSRVVNRKTWESLIKAGAMDAFGERGTLLHSLDTILALATKIQKERLSAQVDLFGNSDDSTSVIPLIQLQAPPEPLPANIFLQWERELLGLYLSQHPLDDYGLYLDENTVPIAGVLPENDGMTAIVGGTIAEIRQITTKNGQNMAFVKLEDRSGEIELIIFPNLYKESANVWQRDRVITAKGRISARDKNGTLMAEAKFLPDSAEIVDFDTAKNYEKTGIKIELNTLQKGKRKSSAKLPDGKKKPKTAETKLYIRIVDDSKSELLMQIKSLLDDSRGTTEVVLVLGEPSKKQALKLPFSVNIEETLTRSLAEIVGTTNVVVQ